MPTELRFDRTIYVDQDGVIIDKQELKNLYYKTLKLETNERKETRPDGTRVKRVATIRQIEIIGKQQTIF